MSQPKRAKSGEKRSLAAANGEAVEATNPTADNSLVPTTSSPSGPPTKVQKIASHILSTPDDTQVSLPGFSDVTGVIRSTSDPSRFFYVDTVYRLSYIFSPYIRATPQWHYELLQSVFGCECTLKLENLQRFGDIHLRQTCGIIVSSFLSSYTPPTEKSQVSPLPITSQSLTLLTDAFAKSKGFLVIVDPTDAKPSSSAQAYNNYYWNFLDSTVMTALFCGKEVTVICAPGTYSLLLSVQLYLMKAAGAKLIFLDSTDTNQIRIDSKILAQEKSLTVIDFSFISQWAMLGAATIGFEMLEETPGAHTVILPYQNYSVSWTYILGTALVLKSIKPEIRICLARLDEKALEKKPISRIFPDLSESNWISLVHEKASLQELFDTLDTEGRGVVSQISFQNFLNSIGANSSKHRVQFPRDKFNWGDFKSHLITQRLESLKNVPANTMSLYNFAQLDNLMKLKIVDEVATLSTVEIANAFLRTIDYTHTLVDAKGAIALASLFYSKFQVRENEKVIALVTGGQIDVVDLQIMLEYAFEVTGHNLELHLQLPDDFPSISGALEIISRHGASVYDVDPSTCRYRAGIGKMTATIKCTTTSFTQQLSLIEELRSQGFIVLNDDNLIRDFLVQQIPSAQTQKYLETHVATSTSLTPLSSPSSVRSTPSTPSTSSSSTGQSNSLNNRPVFARTPSSTSLHRQVAASKLNKSMSETDELPFKRDITDINAGTIRIAHNRIKDNLFQTPIYHSRYYSDICGCQIYLMLDNIQKTGSFKIRGSSNMVIKSLENAKAKVSGLVAASAGNHAQGLAYISAKLEIPCAIVCPEWAFEAKLRWIRAYGAELIQNGKSLEQAQGIAEKIVKERNWVMVRPFDDIDVIEGQGTIAHEIYDSIPDVDTVVVNVGGGGLIAGIALYLKSVKPNVRIIGVQSEAVSPLASFKQTRTLRYIDPDAVTIADGTNVKIPGGVHTKILYDYVDEYVTVAENEIAPSIVHLLQGTRTLSEGAGCIGFAALLNGKIKVAKDEKVCVVLCGGNLDVSVLRKAYEHGLRNLGRAFKVNIVAPDVAGKLTEWLNYAQEAALTLREIQHQRGAATIGWNEAVVGLSFYSNSFKHQIWFLNKLVQAGYVPEIQGRSAIPRHQEIYAPFDEAIQKKKTRITRIGKEERD